MKKTEAEIQGILMKSGLTVNYLGFSYLSYMVFLCQESSGYLPVYLKELYCEAAQKYHTSSYCIERDTRTAVQVIWRNGRPAAAVGSGTNQKCPTNRQFILSLMSSVNVD